MNASHLHLAINHFPLMTVFFGIILLTISHFLKSRVLLKTALITFIVAGIFTVPTFISGEEAEEILENILDPQSKKLVEAHEDAAKLATVMLMTLSVAALLTLLMKFRKILLYSVFAIAIATAMLVAKANNLGGQIRHTEIRSGSTPQTPTYIENNNIDSEND